MGLWRIWGSYALQFRPCCPAETLGNRRAAALSLAFLGLWSQVVACSGSSQGVSGQALRIRKGVPEEGHMLDRKRMFPIGGKAQSWGKAPAPPGKTYLIP